MKRPIIGITAGEAVNMYYPDSPKVYGQMYVYIEAIERAGGVPLVLPIVKSEAVLKDMYDLCDGILLAGGNDVNPACYNEPASEHTRHIHKERDVQEIALWELAKKDDKPVLAVCRGLHIVNTAQGGKLYQDIHAELPEANVHRIPEGSPDDYEHQVVHQVKFKPGSKLAQIMGEGPLGANSYHHQAIKQLGKDVEAVSWSEDEVIEGIEVKGQRFAVGVQSHPESLEATIEPAWRKLFSAFVEAGQSKK